MGQVIFIIGMWVFFIIGLFVLNCGPCDKRVKK